jgi:hypothetical protein
MDGEQADVRHPFTKENSAYVQAQTKLVDAKAKKANQQAKSEKSNSEMRLDLTKEIKAVFGKLNVSVFAIVAVLALIDVVLILAGKEPSKDRLISEKIVLALIAGTVAQAGAAFIAIVGYLFPKKQSKASETTSEKSTTSVVLGFVGGTGLGLFLGIISAMNPATTKTASPDLAAPTTASPQAIQTATQVSPPQLGALTRNCDAPSTSISVVQSFEGINGPPAVVQKPPPPKPVAPPIPKTDCHLN